MHANSLWPNLIELFALNRLYVHYALKILSQWSSIILQIFAMLLKIDILRALSRNTEHRIVIFISRIITRAL